MLKPASVAIRPMRDADLDAVIAIERGAYEFPWSPGIFRDCLRVGYSCWVLEVDRVVRGYGIMQVQAGESHVLNLCIEVDSQGRGLGAVLLGRLLDVARDHHAETALLEVRPTNRNARKLYDRMGFHEVGVRRGYYPGAHGREDALILARSLAAPSPD